MNRSTRLWWLALAGSLLLHAWFLGAWSWTLPQWQDPLVSPPIEARLMPEKRVEPPRPSINSSHPPPRPRPVLPPEPPAKTVAEAPEPEAAADTAVLVPIQAMTDDLPEIEPVEENPPAAEAEVTGPPLNDLPPRLDLRFDLRYGLASGEQMLLWINDGEHYTITSVASATGLAGVFYRGRFAQTSRGRITPRGLVPEEFWDQRGDKRSSAHFDAASNTLTLSPAHGAPRHFSYQGDVQDVLSLFFQLALTAPPPESQLAYTVFNGKKLRNYRYDVRGEEMVETALGVLRALHLERAADGDGRFEIWLAVDRHYLPLRVRQSDGKGNAMELVVRSIEP